MSVLTYLSVIFWFGLWLAPIVLRRETSGGHGARAVSRTVELAADQLAFLAAATGLHADDRIEHKTQALEQASTALMQRMYEQQQSAAGGGAGPGGSSGGAGGGAPGGKQDDVLDAEFEEVKESDRKKA